MLKTSVLRHIIHFFWTSNKDIAKTQLELGRRDCKLYKPTNFLSKTCRTCRLIRFFQIDVYDKIVYGS